MTYAQDLKEMKEKQLSEETWKKIKELMMSGEFEGVQGHLLLEFGNKYHEILMMQSNKLSKIRAKSEGSKK